MLFYVEIKQFWENMRKLTLCSKPLYKSDKKINFTFSFYIQILSLL